MLTRFILFNLIVSFCHSYETNPEPVTPQELEEGTYKAVTENGTICSTLPILNEFTMVVRNGKNGQETKVTAEVNEMPLVHESWSPLVWYKKRSVRSSGGPKCMHFTYSIKEVKSGIRSAAAAFMFDLFELLGLPKFARPISELAFCLKDDKWTAHLMKIVKHHRIVGFKHTSGLIKDRSGTPQTSSNNPQASHPFMEGPPKKRKKKEPHDTKRRGSRPKKARQETAPIARSISYNEEGLDADLCSSGMMSNVYASLTGTDDDTKNLRHRTQPVEVDEKPTQDDIFDLDDLDSDTSASDQKISGDDFLESIAEPTNAGLKDNPIQEQHASVAPIGHTNSNPSDGFEDLLNWATTDEDNRDMDDVDFNGTVQYPDIVDEILKSIEHVS